MYAATLGAPRVTATLGATRRVPGLGRIPQASARALVPVRALGSLSQPRVVAGRTFVARNNDAPGIHSAASKSPASWTRAVHAKRGSQNINTATAPNGACVFFS